jgi:hypothetical protein
MSRLCTAVLATVLLTANAAAVTAAPAYVGTWGTDAAQCKLPQDTLDAPMIVKAKGYDQFETHCTFTSVRKMPGGWKVQSRCAVEGDKQKHTFVLKVAGDTLTMTEGKVARTLARCR